MVEQQDIKWITTNIEECQEKKYCNTKTQSLVPAKWISSGSKNNTTSELSDSVKCQARKKKHRTKSRKLVCYHSGNEAENTLYRICYFIVKVNKQTSMHSTYTGKQLDEQI